MQTDDMAQNKSTSNKWLGAHVLVYCFCFWGAHIIWLIVGAIFFRFGVDLPYFSPIIFGGFIFLNGMLHFCVDWVTSRCSGHFWAKGDRHNFFVVVGFDQFIHAVTLILTAKYLIL